MRAFPPTWKSPVSKASGYLLLLVIFTCWMREGGEPTTQRERYMLRSRRNISPAAGPIDTTWLQACHFPLPPPPKTINPRVFLCPVLLLLQKKKKKKQQTNFLSQTRHLFLCVVVVPVRVRKTLQWFFVLQEKQQRRRRTVYIGRAHLYCADFISTRAEQRWCFDFLLSPLHSPSFRRLPSFSSCFLFFRGEIIITTTVYDGAHPSLYYRTVGKDRMKIKILL